MAITNLKPIKVTVGSAVSYIEKDKIVSLKNDVEDTISYAIKDKEKGIIVYKTFTTGINCNAKNATEAFEKIRNMHGKNSGNLAYHVWQNFGEQVEPKLANEIGVKLAKELYGEYQCIVSTHTNTDYTHNHIIFNSVTISDGRKFNDCKKAKQDLRNVSDRLCKEYGLSILENTKECKWVMYKDKYGKTRFYEPTKRKNEIIRNREINNYDVNNYTNTDAHKIYKIAKKTNVEIIKNDIDRLLPYSKNYEDLLSKMRNIGYVIKDKTKTGDWRVHISFKAPFHEKATRDITIGEEYTRDVLTQKISYMLEENGKENAINYENEKQNYFYGGIDIDGMDADFKENKIDGKLLREERSIVEKYILADTKELNRKINEEMKNVKIVKNEKIPIEEDKRKQYLIDRINGNLRTLRFVEEKGIQSFDHINESVKILCEKRNMAYLELKKISNSLKSANETMIIMDKYKELKAKIDEAKAINDVEYQNIELHIDENILKSYESLLKRKEVFDERRFEDFRRKYGTYNERFIQLKRSMDIINKKIKEYDDCVFNLKAVDKENRNIYGDEIKRYYDMKNENNESNYQYER